MEKEVELASAISYKNNHKTEDHNANINADKAKVKEKSLRQAKSQYSTSNFSIFKVFPTNLIGLAVYNTDLFEFEEINYSHNKFFVASIIKKKLEYCFLKPIIMI